VLARGEPWKQKIQFAGGDTQRGGQRGEVVAVVCSQLVARPRDHIPQTPRLAATPGRQTCEQPVVGVSAYDLALEFAQPSDDLARLRPAGGDVAEADDLFNSAAS
jgi:hypothetical protein